MLTVKILISLTLQGKLFHSTLFSPGNVSPLLKKFCNCIKTEKVFWVRNR